MTVTETNAARDATAAGYASTVLGAGVSPHQMPEALRTLIFKNLSREEEIAGKRDKWGNWEGPAGKHTTAFHRAFLDREIITWGGEAGIARRSLWPNGAKWGFCLTHDMDFVSRYARWHEVALYFQRRFGGGGGPRFILKRLCGGLLRSLGGFRRDPLWCFEKWLELAADAGIPATWFIFPHRVSHPQKFDTACSFSEPVRFDGRRMTVREMIREIGAAGMEIGLHPSVNAATDAAQLRDQKQQVEEASGSEVVSVRQHFLRWDPARTPCRQAEAGLKVDSTLGFNRSIGFRTGGCFPYRMPGPASGETLDLIELPLQLMDVTLFGSDGLGCRTVDDAVSACIGVMDEVESAGGVLVLNWHPDSISNERLMAVLHAILREAKSRRPWGATVRGVASHWLSHHAGAGDRMKGEV